ncbi:hypothetical protein HJFPF1_08719 [Paramyrothecium foliicola]|nr:hypothetical protein HJFPF1_08719 [Paramyrothecium foliicola]
MANMAPFFGGSQTLTLAEVLVGLFIFRLYAFARNDILLNTLISELAEQAPNFLKRAEATTSHPSVNNIFYEEGTVQRYKARIAKAREA